MTELVQVAVILAGQVFTAGAIWGALRADVRSLVREVADAKMSAARAHERIDEVLQHQAQR